MNNVIKLINKELSCPNCGALESHPDENTIQIRAYKVHDEGVWWSQCLVCSGGYDKPNGIFTQANHNVDAGWFHE